MAAYEKDRVHAVFWDIESLGNVFTNCAFDHDAQNADGTHGRLDVFYLTSSVADLTGLVRSDPRWAAACRLIAERIRERNSNFSGHVYFHDLGSPDPAERDRANDAMALIFGASDAGTESAVRWAKARRKSDPALPATGGTWLDPTDGAWKTTTAEVVPMASDPRAPSTFGARLRLATDTDVEGRFVNMAGEIVETHPFDEDISPYLMGYNSFNYDTTMLALYFAEAWVQDPKTGSWGWRALDPATMRTLNDALFASDIIDRMSMAPAFGFDTEYKRFNPSDRSHGGPRVAEAIRKNMIDSGRHIDVARLNEKQYKTGLKRLLGMLGLQILESDKLRDAQCIYTLDDFAELVAYNVSDVVNLRELFLHPAYSTQFENKRALMRTYPDTVYDRAKPTDYVHVADPFHVRQWGRLCPDSKSAQFAARVLCPWDHLKDIPAVSFDYPSPRQAAIQGIERYNVLESCKDFIEAQFGLDSPVWAEFKPVYDYYKSIEGRNLNDSDAYNEDYEGTPNYVEPSSLADVEKHPTCVHYWERDNETGELRPTDCYANFSTGGIHGAEMDLRAHDMVMAEWNNRKSVIDYARALFQGDAVACRKAKTFTFGGAEHSWQEVLKASRPIAKSEWRDPEATKPALFVASKDGTTKLHPKWAYTSAALSNHEDFSSYYPNMLRQMDAFRNERLPEDRYAKIYEQKQTFGAFEKDQSLPEAERNEYHLIREGTKLILNAATGKADSRTEGRNPIRVNNQIMSMRIIGQLFSWRIGQAQALKGAQVISTNTDGLYTVMDEVENAQILREESAKIGVEIVPEPVFLISKDANNRIECDPKDHHRIFDARGGSLACRRGPDPTKSLAHPAILDWLTAEYLICATDGDPNHPALEDPFDTGLARSLLDKAARTMESRELLRMFANVVASSTGSRTFVFARKDEAADPRILQHYNRVFIMRDEAPDTWHLLAAHTRKLTPAIIAKRAREENTRRVRHDPVATKVLAAHGITVSDIQALSSHSPADYEAAIKRFPGIDPEAWMLIENRSLADLADAEVARILSGLDLDAYVERTAESFEKNWRRKA